ncbi:MAG: hypothetical protein AAF747_06835 [Planctomycetota bacterium]
MSQFGMQMPGGRARQRPEPDVYTGLMVLATVALLAACALVYLQSVKIGPDGNAIGLQDESSIRIAE